MHIWKWFRQFCSYKPLAKWTYLELIPLIALLSLVSLSLFWSSLQALSEKPWSHLNLKEFWSFGIVLGISVGGFCWITYFVGYASWCILGPTYVHCIWVKCWTCCWMICYFSNATVKKMQKNKISCINSKKRKRKAVKLCE